MLDAQSRTAAVVASEYASCVAESWSSKSMLQLIRRKADAHALAASELPSPSSITLSAFPLLNLPKSARRAEAAPQTTCMLLGGKMTSCEDALAAWPASLAGHVSLWKSKIAGSQPDERKAAVSC